MIKILKISLSIAVLFIAFKVNSIHYKKLADDRIEKAAEVQGADISKAKTTYDSYDYFASAYVKYIYFNADPEIEYRYEYVRSEDNVKISAYVNNVSLDLTDKVPEYYPFLNIDYGSDGKIKHVEKMPFKRLKIDP